jgi:hypothetical protein
MHKIGQQLDMSPSNSKRLTRKGIINWEKIKKKRLNKEKKKRNIPNTKKKPTQSKKNHRHKNP